ncbi:MAG TPA: cytidine deaminase [Caldilineae bacterium]|nr:cytidine deaminase [Caldilineae bacterium]
MNTQKLLDMAQSARDRAYAPYSHYAVGAALLTESGKIFTGCNVENAVYPATCCAERVAIFKAVSEGHRQFRAIVVATEDGGSPCGVCRQVMREFSPEMIVFIMDAAGKVRETSVAALLPDSFGPENLGRATGSG